MKILVLGGTRFIGKHLVRALIADNHDVTIATRGITPDNFVNKVKRVIIDRTNGDIIKSVLSNNKYDVIFDSLAYCSNDVKAILDSVKCEKYIFISTTAVYDKHINTKEEEFDPLSKLLIWCSRNDFSYDEIKRQAECVVAQKYADIKYNAVRFPYVIGTDDYTKRLYFYIDHIIKEKSMFIDNYENQMSFIRSDESGKFLAFLAKSSFTGAINGASEQTISIKEIADYVNSKTGKTAILSNNGDISPYNGETEYSINIDKAKNLGFSFTPLKSWIYELIDNYIDEANKK